MTRAGDPGRPSEAADCPVRIAAVAGGVLLDVKVIPRARSSGPDGALGEALKLRLASPPVDGKANAECVGLVATLMGLPKRDVTVVRGETGRQKTLLLRGVSADHVRATVRQLLAPAGHETGHPRTR